MPFGFRCQSFSFFHKPCLRRAGPSQWRRPRCRHHIEANNIRHVHNEWDSANRNRRTNGCNRAEYRRLIRVVTIRTQPCFKPRWLGRGATLGVMETRCPVAGQAGAPMVAGPLAGQSLGGMEAPMAPVAGQRSAAWKQNGPSRGRLADRWCEMARPRRKPRRCGTGGYCQCPRDRNNGMDRSGV